MASSPSCDSSRPAPAGEERGDNDGPEPGALPPQRSRTSTVQPARQRHSSTARRRPTAADTRTADVAAVAKGSARATPIHGLPLSHIQAHVPFYLQCQQPLDPMARDWNAEFQDLWVWHSRRQVHSADGREQLREFLVEYETHCLDLVEGFVADHERGLSTLPGRDCVRVGNLVVQVWRDVKLAQNMQRCFCAAMECRPPNLLFPLTATFRYLHVALSVQALVPLRQGKGPEYRGDGMLDAVVNLPLCEYLHALRCATNVKPSPAADPLEKMVGFEVYEALDAAFYVFNCIGLLPSMRPAAAGRAPGPLRRWRHMATHEARTWSEQPCMEQYAITGHEVYSLLASLLQEPAQNRLERLVERLHESGLNVCLLGTLAQRLMQTPKDEQEADQDALLRLIATEMLARAIREVVCTQMTHDVSPGTPQAANVYLMRAMASVVDNPITRFHEGLERIVGNKFIFDASVSPEPINEYLASTLQDFPSSVTQRLCQLMCVSIMRGAVADVKCKASKHNSSARLSPQRESIRLQMLHDAIYVHPAPSDEFLHTYVLPLQEEQSYRAGRLDSAWESTKRVLAYWQALPHARFMSAHACSAAALCAATCGRVNAAEHLASTLIQTLQHSPMYAAEPALTVTGATSSAAAGPGAAATATVATGASNTATTSRYGVFVLGLARARLTQGYVRCLAKRYFDAEGSFDAALRTPDILGQWRLPYLFQLRLEAIMGLLEVATHGSEEYIARFARLWEATCETLPATLLGARVHELLGSLYMERRMHELAAIQLWECVDLREMLLGDESPEVAQTLNRLGLLYYNWDSVRCGLYCSCVLHRAEAVMASAHGPYSAQHLAVSENIIALFIRRGQFVEASQRLHTLQHLPPRYVRRLPRDHPTIIRLADLETKLRSAFVPWATLIIQRSWRQYRARLLVRKVLEEAARVLQRAGRAMGVRRTLALISEQRASLEDIFAMETLTAALTASDSLVRMCRRFSRQARDWNMEYQSCRFLCEWSTADEITSTVKQLNDIRNEFNARATELAAHRNERLFARHPRGGPADAASGAAPFVKDNILVQPIPKNDRLCLLQDLVYQHFSRSLFSVLTAPLSTIVQMEQCDYFVVALPPLHNDPEYLLLPDGRCGPAFNSEGSTFLREAVQAYSDAGLTSMSWDSMQGTECVRAQDGLYYITNGLGLVNNLLLSDHLNRDMVDPGITPLPERAEWTPAPNLSRRVLNLIVAGKADEALSAIETYAMSSAVHTAVQRATYSVLIEMVRAGKSGDTTALEAVGLRATSSMESTGAWFLATALGLMVARALCARDGFKSALPFLTRNVFLLRRKLRLHAYFSAYLMLDNTMLLLTAANGCKKPVDSATLDFIVPTLELAEPSCLLFTVLERMILYCQLNGRNNLAEDLQALRTTRAKQLVESLRKHLVTALMRSSEACAQRSAVQESVPFLTASIHLSSVRGGTDAASVELGVLFTRYGAALTALNDLFSARKVLSKAWSILSKVTSTNSAEVLTLYKHNRILKARLRDNAILVIRRAVRRWREQRRLDAVMARDKPGEFMKLQNVRVLRRMNRLVVSEATSRVLVLEAQTEAWYRLLRKQMRLRNEAMLRQTYGTRVQIFVDKIDSALVDLMELALASKATVAEYGLRMQRCAFTTMIETTHRLERRAVIREWSVACMQLKIWHVENVDGVIRKEFLSAYQRYLLRCVSAEEGIWRRTIAQNQIKTKKMVGRYIVKKLRQRPRNPSGDYRAVETEEARLREKILVDEAQAFKSIGNVFIFGPEVVIDDEDDW